MTAGYSERDLLWRQAESRAASSSTVRTHPPSSRVGNMRMSCCISAQIRFRRRIARSVPISRLTVFGEPLSLASASLARVFPHRGPYTCAHQLNPEVSWASAAFASAARGTVNSQLPQVRTARQESHDQTRMTESLLSPVIAKEQRHFPAKT
jgi:hypothetical protein